MMSKLFLGLVAITVIGNGFFTPLSAERLRDFDVKEISVIADEEDVNVDIVEAVLLAEAGNIEGLVTNPNSENKLLVRLTQWSKSYLLQVEWTRAGNQIRSGSVKLRKLDELDTGLARILMSLAEGKSLASTRERGKILASENRRHNRYKSIKGWNLSLGTKFPMTPAFSSYEPLAGVGLGYTWEVDNFGVELQTEFMSGFDDHPANLFKFGIGAHYYFWSNRQHSLFAGVNLGLGTYSGSGVTDSNQGAVFATTSVGALLWRHADINLDFRLQTDVMIDKYSGHVPALGGVMLGLRF